MSIPPNVLVRIYRQFGHHKRLVIPISAIITLVLLAVIAWVFGVPRLLSIMVLRENLAILQGFVTRQWLVALFAFVTVYSLAIATAMPGKSILSMAGGLLFGAVPGTAAIVASCLVGSLLMFMAVRRPCDTLFGAFAAPRIEKLRSRFSEQGFFYLLFLRLIPFFPFTLVTLLAAASGMRIAPFLAATAIGTTPASFIFASFGTELDGLLSQGSQISPSSVLSTQMLLILIGLACLALAPTIFKSLDGCSS